MTRSLGQKRATKDKLGHPRLCWTRHELAGATGLSYRTLINLEKRGLLHRCLVGVNVACYTDASVQALFAGDADSKEAEMIAPRPVPQSHDNSPASCF